ncbi:MAG TPA: rhomboid family intramembrane serine protease [Acidobacteriota bacterium]|nr:rhomboid family intramembrane serine protease [Acidobacteriota bacterium]
MLLLPYAHERQTVQRLPWITFGLIALNVLIFLITTYGSGGVNEGDESLYQFREYIASHPYLKIPTEMEQFFDEQELDQLAALREVFDTSTISAWDMEQEQGMLNSLAERVLEAVEEDPFQKYGYVPSNPSFASLLTCMFLHAGWLHLIGNMLFLYLVGCSIEDLWGRPLYIGFYTIGGIAATLTHVLKYPTSDDPLIGASGAIAALMGAFLIRLYDTKISFFYMLGFWYRGTFQAPAYIMLPLWLLQQFWEASLLGEVASVAFYAHIGGFLFGAVFAAGMKYWRVEEKYIAPKIEKKVSLAQNPDFLKAMDLSENGSFPEALILLEKVVRQEPNHFDAFMEMRRISEMNKDYRSYSKYTGSIFEILVRNRDRDFLLELYQQFREHPMRQSLPARTLLTLGSFFEEGQEYDAAMQQYEELAENYPDDPLAMRAYSKLARICFDRFNNPERATEAFWKSYYHKSASDQWQTALQADMKRYNIAPRERPAASTTASPVGATLAASRAFIGEPSMRTAEGYAVEETVPEIPPATAQAVEEQPQLAKI